MEILVHPNPALKQVCELVDPTDDATLKVLARDMAEAMYGSHGIGLAAPQIGILKRIIVVDVDEEVVRPIALCNPTVVEHSEELVVSEEGCLSVPGIDVPIERPAAIVVEALSLEGKAIRFQADGLLARCIQHEIDHLDGVTIIERAKPEHRMAALRDYREAQARGESERGVHE